LLELAVQSDTKHKSMIEELKEAQKVQKE